MSMSDKIAVGKNQKAIQKTQNHLITNKLNKMKKSILAFALFVITGISTSFASTKDDVNVTVTNSFKKDFAAAKEVKWETGRFFIKASFQLNNHVLYAYYNASGELLAVTRNIVSSQLPITQLVALNKNYRAYWITDLFELNADGQTTYYITLENADSKTVLKSTTYGWEVYRKDAKQ